MANKFLLRSIVALHLDSVVMVFSGNGPPSKQMALHMRTSKHHYVPFGGYRMFLDVPQLSPIEIIQATALRMSKRKARRHIAEPKAQLKTTEVVTEVTCSLSTL